MAEYIDRDMLIAEGWHMQRTIRSMTSIAIEIKKPTDFPAADVVEVVRCKDCKYSYDGVSSWCCSYGVFAGCIMPGDFYCKCGKRKEGQR